MEAVFFCTEIKQTSIAYREKKNTSQTEIVSLANYSFDLKLEPLRKYKFILEEIVQQDLALSYISIHVYLLDSLQNLLIVEQDNVESMRSLYAWK